MTNETEIADLPTIPAYDIRVDQGLVALMEFVGNLRDEHLLTPGQTLFILNRMAGILLSDCMSAEREIVG